MRFAPSTAAILTELRPAGTVNVTGTAADSPGARPYSRPVGEANSTSGVGLSHFNRTVPERAPPLFQNLTFKVTGLPAVAHPALRISYPAAASSGSAETPIS